MTDFIADEEAALISCPSCLKEFDKPKVLPCWHTFCSKCLESNLPENSITVVCPTCSMPSILPRQGVYGLQDNWLLNLINEESGSNTDRGVDVMTSSSGSSLCYGACAGGGDLITCSDRTPSKISSIQEAIHPLENITEKDGNFQAEVDDYDRWETAKLMNDDKDSLLQSMSTGLSSDNDRRSSQQNDAASTSAVVVDDAGTTETSRSCVMSLRSLRSSPDFSNDKIFCKLHPNKQLILYCNQWDLPMCGLCTTDEHSKHRHVGLDLAVLSQKEDLVSLVYKIKEKTDNLLLSKTLLQRTRDELRKNFDETKKKAAHGFERLQCFIADRQNNLMQEMNETFEQKSRIIEKQLEVTDYLLHDAEKCYQFTEKVLDSDRNETVLLANKILSSSMLHRNHFHKTVDNLRPAESSFVDFDTRQITALMESCENINGIIWDKQLCAGSIILSKEDLSRHHPLDRIIKIGVYHAGDSHKWLDNFKDKLCNSIYAEVLEQSGKRTVATVVCEPVGAKIGEIQFTAHQQGTAKIEVFSYGCVINRSPFEITVTKAATTTSQKSRIFLEKSKSLPLPNKTSIPISIRSTGSKLPVGKVVVSSSSVRPPWNSSSHLTTSLKRSESSLAVRSTMSLKRSQTGLQSLTDLSNAQLQPQQELAFKNRYYGSMQAVKKKIERQDKIEEEDLESPEVRVSNQTLKGNANVKSKLATLSRPIHGKPPIQPVPAKTKRELPTLHKSLTRVEPLYINKFLDRRFSLKNTPRGTQDNSVFYRTVSRAKGCTQIGEFSHVQGVYFKDGLISVTDSKTCMVQVFCYKSGSLLKKFDCHESGCRHLTSSITGIVRDSSGNFYVADYTKGCVLVFDKEGRVVGKIGQDTLKGPKGLILDREENLVVVDTKGCNIRTYSTKTGQLLKQFGSGGYKDAELCSPHFCALTPSGDNVVITNFREGKVKIFTLEGELVVSFGSEGVKESHFKKPTGVAVDQKTGNIIVSDFENSRIQIFNSEGQFKKTINTTSSPLSGPMGICLTDDGHVIVADSGNRCLKVLNYSG